MHSPRLGHRRAEDKKGIGGEKCWLHFPLCLGYAHCEKKNWKDYCVNPCFPIITSFLYLYIFHECSHQCFQRKFLSGGEGQGEKNAVHVVCVCVCLLHDFYIQNSF